MSVQKKEELENRRRDDLYHRMREIRLSQGVTFGERYKYVRGKGLVKRDCVED